MTMRVFILTLIGAAFFSSPSAFAGSIESEPLPPPPGLQGSSGAAPKPIPTNVAPAPRPGSGASAPASPMSTPPSSGDNGMAGGGGSAYDLGVEAGAPPMDTSPERDTGAPPANVSPPPEPYTYKPTVRDNPVVRMGYAPPENPALQNAKFCTLNVLFAAAGGTIDTKTSTRMKTYLAENADKLAYKTARRGDGESFCIDVNAHNQRAKTYMDLKKLLPSKNDTVPETRLLGEGFAPVTTFH